MRLSHWFRKNNYSKDYNTKKFYMWLERMLFQSNSKIILVMRLYEEDKRNYL